MIIKYGIPVMISCQSDPPVSDKTDCSCGDILNIRRHVPSLVPPGVESVPPSGVAHKRECRICGHLPPSLGRGLQALLSGVNTDSRLLHLQVRPVCHHMAADGNRKDGTACRCFMRALGRVCSFIFFHMFDPAKSRVMCR